MRKRPACNAALMAAAILWVAQVAAQNSKTPAETFRARLSTVPIDASMMATTAGSGSLTAVLEGRKLTVSGTFQGLRSPATAARVHRGPKGLRGPAIFDLTVTKAPSGTISGSLDLSPAQVEDLKSGRVFVQVYSEQAPEGNLRGWLLR